MRLKRSVELSHFPEHRSIGTWSSADGRWLIFCLGAKGIGRPGWSISATRIGNEPNGAAEFKKRDRLLKQSGLWDASFKTRRQAVDALLMVLASASESEAL